MYVYLQIFFKDLEFSRLQMAYFNYFFFSILIVFECIGSRRALTVT